MRAQQVSAGEVPACSKHCSTRTRYQVKLIGQLSHERECSKSEPLNNCWRKVPNNFPRVCSSGSRAKVSQCRSSG